MRMADNNDAPVITGRTDRIARETETTELEPKQLLLNGSSLSFFANLFQIGKILYT